MTGQKIRYTKVLLRHWTGSRSQKTTDKAVSFRKWYRNNFLAASVGSRARLNHEQWLKADFQSVPRNLGFVYDFCFVSCKTSQNVAFRIYLHEVNSNFHDNRHFRREALCFILPGISLDENLHYCKNQWSFWKKSLKGLKDKVCDSYRITSIRIPSSEPFVMFINIRFWDCAVRTGIHL